MKCVICGDKLAHQAHSDVCITCIYEVDEAYLKKRRKAMYELKHALSSTLNMVKGFEVGYSSVTNEAIVVEHEGKTFILKFEYKENLTLEEVVDKLW